MLKDLKYVFYMDGTPEEVWEILISPEGTKQIYYGSVIRSPFQAGDRLEYVGPGADGDETIHVYGQVLEYVPQQIFRFSHFVGKSYIKEGEQEYESRISYLLEPVGASTKLTLIHDQWQDGDTHYESSDAAWWMILSNTKTLIETGKTLHFG